MQQALDRAVANGVKNLVVQPTHLMHGAEYDEMVEAIDEYKDKFESVADVYKRQGLSVRSIRRAHCIWYRQRYTGQYYHHCHQFCIAEL